MCETKNENSSNLLRGISENGGILFYGIDSTAIVRRMEQLHKTSAVTTAALGRLLTGVAMMGQMLKSDSDSVTVQIKGGGPAGRILAVSNGAGDVKGYVENSIVELPPRADGHLNVGAAGEHQKWPCQTLALAGRHLCSIRRADGVRHRQRHAGQHHYHRH